MAEFAHMALVLPVLDLSESSAFYEEKLGFDKYFQWGEPVEYLVFKKGGITINLVQNNQLDVNLKLNKAFIFCSGIEEIYQTLVDKQVPIVEPLNRTDYGLKEFVIKDNSGYRIAFGEGNS